MAKSLKGSYQQLMERSKRLTVLKTAAGIIQWDMETKMPPKGVEQRSEQLSLLDLIAHREIVDPEIGALLDSIEKDRKYESLDELQKRNVHLYRKMYNEEAKLPDELVAATSKQATICVNVWKRAKAAKDFNMFRPELAKMIELREKAADIMMEVKGTKTPYDALLDAFEPGITADKISDIFGGMRKGLMGVMKKIEASGVKPDSELLTRRVKIDAQRKIGQMAMDFVKYDTTSKEAGGRLDETEHPFSTGYFDDVRITTHYHEDRWTSSLFSVLHESGHALYEQDIDQDWKWQPVGNACSYGIHESQSRFVENIVGRSPEFLEFMLPQLRKVCGPALKGVRLDRFVTAVNQVEASKIRIEADEVTYGLHIIIRFEIERDLFAGKVKVNELPQVWNEKYDKYLGVEIENDSEGVMQDTHWAGGSFGYFPSYALGNIYGGMFLRKMEKDVPEWREEVRKGNYVPVGTWLKDNVHSKGNMYDPADLVKHVTGKNVEIEPFIAYLKGKMGKIYGF
ncbi:MAG: Carboxypeptidase Taq (M32) metallopeptidase [Methanomassiliicoccales archaeon PtaU1.Bin124]|nr:MAG: Carboxypeptidase Taq (M32) metallopeptidase [Methanomassiliicoccales archaeon PtaU1.Bin124]